MYIIRNAFKNLIRNKGRNMLVGAIIFAIITTTVIALCINNTTKGIIDDYKDRFGSEVFLSPNMDKFMSSEGGAKTSMLTVDQYIEYSKSDYIKEFLMSVSQEIAGDKIKAVDEKPVPDGIDVGGTGGEGGDAYVNPKMILKGNTWEDFDKGSRKVVDGRMVESNDECLISKEVAELNNLSVGDTVTFKGSTGTSSGNLRTMSYEFTISGIYFDATDEYAGAGKNSLSNRRNEVLTTTEGVTNALNPGDSGLGVTTQYFLKDPSMLSTYESELRDKGLSDYYDVKTDEAGYDKVVGPVEGLRNISISFMIIVLILGSVILILLSSIAIRERKYEIGVLRAMGMKKRKVALGLWAESLIVTTLCLFIGLGAGALISQPVTNTLLAGQIENAQAAENAQSIGGQFYYGGMNDSTTDSSLTPIDELDVSVSWNTIIEIIAISLLLASVAGFASVLKITKYEPIKILMERN